MRRFAHLVNPVRAAAGTELAWAQPLTFASMRRARAEAEAAGLAVELWTACHRDERVTVEGFAETAPLTRTVMDLDAFPVERPLPLLGDLLARLCAATDAPWLVYSNVDIVLRPDFYRAVDAQLTGGADALCLHRTTVYAEPAEAHDLDVLYARAGEPHPGHDCFVLDRRLLDGISFGGLSIGFPPVGLVLAAVLSTTARRFVHGDGPTLHVNDTRTWYDARFDAFYQHNRREALAILDALAARTPLSPLAVEARGLIAGWTRLDA